MSVESTESARALTLSVPRWAKDVGKSTLELVKMPLLPWHLSISRAVCRYVHTPTRLGRPPPPSGQGQDTLKRSAAWQIAAETRFG
jgi:hypothetical protein